MFNKIELTKYIELECFELIRKLMSKGYSAELVGGAVRDIIMGNKPKDYDIATSATPDQVRDVFKDYDVIPTGESFGTVTVIYNGTGYEITTYRLEADYDDSRHPRTVKFSKSLLDDLSRRDLTMNAMAMRLKSKISNNKELEYDYEIIDPYNGIYDIEHRRIVCVENPMDRFNEDPLRIMRAVRFAYKYNFSISGGVFLAILTFAHKLRLVSGERIKGELNQILTYYRETDSNCTNKQSFIAILQILDENFIKMDGFNQNNPYHKYDLLNHTLYSMLAVEGDYRDKLVMLLHDVGKIYTKTTSDDTGISHFYGHANKSAELAEEFLRKYKYSNDEINYITTLIKYHDMQVSHSEPGIKRAMMKVGIEIFPKLIAVKKADISAQSLKYFDIRNNSLDFIMGKYKVIIERKEALSLKDLAINGDTIMKKFNLDAGPYIGELLNNALDWVLTAPNDNNEEALLKYIAICIELDKKI